MEISINVYSVTLLLLSGWAIVISVNLKKAYDKIAELKIKVSKQNEKTNNEFAGNRKNLIRLSECLGVEHFTEECCFSDTETIIFINRNPITPDTKNISNVTLEELAQLVIDGTPITRKESVEVVKLNGKPLVKRSKNREKG